MNKLYIFFGFIIIFLILFFGTTSYHTEQNIVIKNRCPPTDIILPSNDVVKQEANVVNLYNESEYIDNKGFVNELMYKPKFHSSVEYDNIEIVPLKANENVSTKSIDLPIANININYMLKNNTTKLTL